ncbi:MAG: insulinase family protein, partial [Gammaproteobacteria bacterium]|nr:insulinase family protein [Gammaproteobacteria bacterium]
DKLALDKKLAGLDVRVSASVGSLTEGIGGSASPRDIETAFQLIYQRFMAPRKDETAFAAYKTLLSGIFANRGASPAAALGDTVSLILTQGHPRAVPPDDEMIERLDLDASFAFYQDRFADASDFVFFFVGAFDPDEMRPLAETWLGGLPSLGRVETWRDVGIDPPDGVIEREVRKGLEPQSQTRIVFAGDAEFSREEEMALAALADVLDIRLRELLREDLGGTYGVGVSSFLSTRPDEEYSVRISFGSAPERAEELAAVVFGEIDRIQLEGPDAETVEKVRETQRRNRETQLEQNRYWLGRLQRLHQLGVDYGYATSYEFIEGWTADHVQEAALRYLRDDRFVKVVLYPENPVP